MMCEEKDKLLAFLDRDGRWCQDAEARDADGKPVKFHDPSAIAWDITGAMCVLFGWQRARALFGQIERHIYRKRRLMTSSRDAAIESMVALQAYNDRPETAIEEIRAMVDTMPVWSGSSRPSSECPLPAEPMGPESSPADAFQTTSPEKKTDSNGKTKKFEQQA